MIIDARNNNNKNSNNNNNSLYVLLITALRQLLITSTLKKKHAYLPATLKLHDTQWRPRYGRLLWPTHELTFSLTSCHGVLSVDENENVEADRKSSRDGKQQPP